MRLRTVTCLGCFVVAAAALGASCKSSSSGKAVVQQDSGPPEADAGVITIGVSNSLTGGLSSTGPALHDAWTVAQTYINSNGGILGRNVQFVEMDDQSDDNTQSDDGGVITGVAQKLLALKPAGVIGPQGSAQVNTVWQLFQAAHVVEISAEATSVEFEALPNDAGPDARYFFRTVPADELQGKALALLAQLGPAGAGGFAPDGGPLSGGNPDGGGDAGGANYCSTLALLHYANAYGGPMSTVFKAHFPGSVVTEQTLTEGEADNFPAQIAAIHAANPQCLAMILYDTDGDAFLQAYQAAYPGPFPFFIMSTDGVYDSTFLTTGLSSPSAPPSSTIVEGVYGTNPDSNPNDSINAPHYNFFQNLYLTEFPLPAGQTTANFPTTYPYAANEFDAAMLLALSIEKAGTATDGQAIRDALLAITNGSGKLHGPEDLTGALQDILSGQEITYTGASGPCRLDPSTGNTTAGYIIWEVVNGSFVTLQHIPAQTVEAL